MLIWRLQDTEDYSNYTHAHTHTYMHYSAVAAAADVLSLNFIFIISNIIRRNCRQLKHRAPHHQSNANHKK